MSNTRVAVKVDVGTTALPFELAAGAAYRKANYINHPTGVHVEVATYSNEPTVQHKGSSKGQELFRQHIWDGIAVDVE